MCEEESWGEDQCGYVERGKTQEGPDASGRTDAFREARAGARQQLSISLRKFKKFRCKFAALAGLGSPFGSLGHV
jgi:hypothetical protein